MDNEKRGNGSRKKSIVEQFKNTHFVMDDAHVNRSLKLIGVFLLVLLSVFTFVKVINEVKTYNTIGVMPTTPYSINVSGKAEVMAKRDTSTLSFSSHGEGKTAADAQTKAAEANNKALAFLKEKGIPQADISTLSYNTYPKYDQKVKPCIIDTSAQDKAETGSAAPASDMMVTSVAPTVSARSAVTPIAPCNSYEQIITGYTTDQTVQIKIRNVDTNPTLAGDIITGLGAAGVQVGSLQNSVDELDQLKAQARQMAIVNARIEAEKIAKALGVKLGKVISYYDSGNDYPMMMESAMAAPGASYDKRMMSPEIPTGESKVTAQVSVSFEIR